jgi:hypothetical protein
MIRLANAVAEQGHEFLGWSDEMPPGSPSHLDVPYAFKAYALAAAAQSGYRLLLWADACILPIQPMDALWAKVGAEGAWISHNGWRNGEWTADGQYEHLGVTREQNWTIPHVVATAFCLNLDHVTGKAIFDEYLRLANTKAFCGPWYNRINPEYFHYPRIHHGRLYCDTCGTPDVRGSRHDQTALSVLAWRNDVQLTDPPRWFAYAGGETRDTVLVADSSYRVV